MVFKYSTTLSSNSLAILLVLPTQYSNVGYAGYLSVYASSLVSTANWYCYEHPVVNSVLGVYDWDSTTGVTMTANDLLPVQLNSIAEINAYHLLAQNGNKISLLQVQWTEYQRYSQFGQSINFAVTGQVDAYYSDMISKFGNFFYFWIFTF